jgi:hypothetical protein
VTDTTSGEAAEVVHDPTLLESDDVMVGHVEHAKLGSVELDNAKALLDAGPQRPEYDERSERPGANMVAHKHYREGVERRRRMMELLVTGSTIQEACDTIGISRNTYRMWRQRFPKWAAECTTMRVAAADGDRTAKEVVDSPAMFVAKYFNMHLTWFQLLFMDELAKLPLGSMLLVLWPPEHGKTTTFENYANMKLASDPAWRFLVASENRGIAQKILGRVMDRMNPLGPTPAYVSQFGPFVPQSNGGMAQVRQPWTDTKFSVYGARQSDERNFSMEAVGVNGSIVSARCDHLHVDDPQSVKTLGQTAKMTTWLRQDALSRPAENGITSICGTRVGEEDIYNELLQDGELDGIMKVLRFPAVLTDHDTGEQKPLDPARHTLDSLDRMRRKVGSEIWDRNWMQNPGASKAGKGTFEKTTVEKLLDSSRSLQDRVGSDGENADPVIYIGVDPALGQKNCIHAYEVRPDGKLLIRRIREDIGFERNEQIMGALESVVDWCQQGGQVTDVVIEEKNFQLGLKNDERLREMASKVGFRIHGHMTGFNKYDTDIGVASMASSLIKGELILPWAPDDLTRGLISEFKRQLYAWKPGVRGSKLRQDYVMAFWFVWVLWRSRNIHLDSSDAKHVSSFTRQTPGWKMGGGGLILPTR